MSRSEGWSKSGPGGDIARAGFPLQFQETGGGEGSSKNFVSKVVDFS